MQKNEKVAHLVLALHPRIQKLIRRTPEIRVELDVILELMEKDIFHLHSTLTNSEGKKKGAGHHPADMTAESFLL